MSQLQRILVILILMNSCFTTVKANNKINPRFFGSVNYYICDDGDDTNNGLSPDTPWKTFDKGIKNFSKLNAGDSIKLCRGGEFYLEDGGWLYNRRCLAEKPCTITDYLPSSLENGERPIIISPTGNTILNFMDGGAADPDGGYVVKNIILQATQAGKGKAAIFLFNDVDDVIMENLKIEGFGTGIQSAGGSTPGPESNITNERIVLRNSEIINNYNFGWLGGCSDCVIDSNVFDNNGFRRAIFNHNIYFSGKHVVSRNVVISNNHLTKSAIVDGKCQGVSLVVHGVVENIRIENNLIQEEINKAHQTCWGIAVDPGWKSEERFENVVIKKNTLINTGNVAIGCGSCVNVLIEDNMILHGQEFSASAIKIPTGTEDSVKSSGFTIRNNTIVLLNTSNKKAAINIKSAVIRGGGIRNNSLYSTNRDDICILLDNAEYKDTSSCQQFH